MARRAWAGKLGPWRRDTWTGSARSTSPSSPTRARRATCTSAAICIFEGPPLSYEDLLEHVRSRLHLVPRFRQKLAYPPVPTGRPFWIDDPAFNLEYHVRHSALPAPGSEEQLRNMAARVFSQQLDRTKPLWELWMVQGLTRKRFAFVTKTHHALVDGVSGVDIATVLFDVKPVPEPAEPDDDWVAEPAAVGRAAARQGRRGPVKAPRAAAAADRAGGRASAHRRRPGLRGGRGARRGRLELRQPGARRCRSTSRSARTAGSSGCAPTWRSSSGSSRSLGGTVNDVVLAVVTGALRRWLHARGVRTEGMELRAQVPVSIRAADERGQLGNKLAACAARSRSTSRTRSSGSRSAARAWRGSSSPSRRSAPR